MSDVIIGRLGGEVSPGVFECGACGVTARGWSPVIDLCRKLVEAGHPSGSPMRVYRGEVVALHVRSIGEAGGLRVRPGSAGRPMFVRRTAAAGALGEGKDEGVGVVAG